jgi:energy-coupling factor transporter ATP-binding protein EcfA2
MTKNVDKWKFFMKDFVSPDSFIEFGYYFLVASALQRRVWLGPPENAIFPNMFVILVGPPGVGKGLVIKEVSKILNHFKLRDKKVVVEGEEIDLDALRIASGIMDMAAQGNKKKVNEDEPLLLPVAPDSISGFEALVSEHAHSTRKIEVPGKHKVFAPNGIYLYNSLTFCLEELSSIFKKNAVDVINYLLVAFDCGDYKYKTKHCGEDRLRKVSLSLIAGTTPSYMQETLDQGLVSGGFNARVVYVFEWANRFRKFILPQFTDEQLKAKADILLHIKKLTGLFGQVVFSPEALELLRHHIEEEMATNRLNHDMRLDDYYGRKNIQLQKLAIAVHFADNTEDFIITLEEAQKAISLLAGIEPRMHYALQFKTRSPLADAGRKVKSMLRQFKLQSKKELWLGLEGEITDVELDSVLSYLMYTEQVEKVAIPDEDTQYRLRPKETEQKV